MSQKILFTFTAQDTNVAQTQEDVKDRLAAINKEIKAAKAAGSPYTALLGESIKLKREATALREEQAKLNKEFKATTVPKDSLAGLRLEYSKLTDQINKLSAAERNSPQGQLIVKNAAKLKGEIKGIEESIGNFTGNVGNYKSALLGLGDAISGGLVTGGIVAGVTAVINVMKVGLSLAVDYEKKLDDLSALTGVTGEGLQGLQNVETSLRNIDLAGVEIVSTGSDILNALKLVGGARPELLADADALGEVTKQAIVLSKAGGDTLQQSVTGLTTVLGQFNQGAADSQRIINELAAGAKVGASEIPQTTDALREFGTVANISNASTSESIALIELLADRQLKGAEAGTQLRNILSKLASADILPKKAQEAFQRLGIDINVLKDSSLPLQVRLEELAKANGDLSALTKVFGLENLQAATIITEGLPKYAALKAGIEGTNEAYIQAGIRSDNASTSLDNLSNRVSNKLQTAFQGATPVISILADQLGTLIENADFASLALNALTAPFGGFKGTDPKNKSPFDIANPLGEQQPDRFGVFKPLTAEEKEAAQRRAVELAKVRGKAEEEENKKESSKKSGAKKEVFAAGSLGALQQEFDALQKKINNTPGDSPLLAGLIASSEEAKQKITTLKNVVEEIRNPSVELTDEQRGLELATGIDAELAIKQAKDLRDKLGAELPSVAQGDSPTDPTAELAGVLDSTQSQKDNEAADAKIAKDKEVRDAIEQQAIDSAQNAANATFQILKNNLAREQELKLAALDAEEAKQIEAANGNAAKEKQIRADFEKKRQALEKEGAQKRKKLAITEAIINIALSVTKALTGGIPPFNLILASAAAIAGGFQLAVINSQQFAKGGKVKRLGTGIVNEKQNAPRTVQGDTVLAYLKPGEMVLNESQQGSIAGIAGHDVFSKAGVPGASRSKPVPFFASGGVVDFIPQTSFSSQGANGGNISASASFSGDQVREMGKNLGVIIAQEVSSQLKIALAEGIGDANRRLERVESLQIQREG